MRLTFSFLLALFLLLLTADTFAQVTVTGTLLGLGDEPMAMSHLVVEDGPTSDTTFVVTVDASGRFAFSLDETGGYGMYAVGVHHETILMPLILTSAGSVELHIRLAASQLVTAIDSLWLVPASSDQGIFMAPRPDGTFGVVVEASADTLAYRIEGILLDPFGWDYLSAGTSQDRFAFNQKGPFWDGEGDYLSVLDVKDAATVEVILDPSVLPRDSAEATIKSSPSIVADIACVYLDVEERERRIGMALGQGIGIRESALQEGAPIREQIRREQNPLLRQWLILRYFDELHPVRDEDSQLLARETLENLPPDSPFWSFEARSSVGASNLMLRLARAAKKPELANAYIQHVVDVHPDPDVRAHFLYSGINAAHGAGDEETKWRYYTQLQAEHRGTSQAERTFRDFDPDREMQAGNPVPKFSFSSLDDPSVTITNGSLRGSTYLIDFWGTWCAPCIEELPSLQQAYDRYRESGFEILSIALLDSHEDIQEFRKDRYPMPWLHTLVAREDDRSVRAMFEITGIPRPILVNEEGIIIAIDDDLRGGKIADAVQAAFDGSE